MMILSSADQMGKEVKATRAKNFWVWKTGKYILLKMAIEVR